MEPSKLNETPSGHFIPHSFNLPADAFTSIEVTYEVPPVGELDNSILVGQDTASKCVEIQNDLLALEAGEQWLIEHNAARMVEAQIAQKTGPDGNEDDQIQPPLTVNQSLEGWRQVCDVVPIAGCVFGVVARKRLTAGTVPATEKALLVVMDGNDEIIPTINAFEQLTADQKGDYLDLAVTEQAVARAKTTFFERHGSPIEDLGPDVALIHGTFSINGWRLDDRAFVFKLGSRFNSRCILPNVAVHYGADGLAECRVLVDVNIGDELTVAYIGSEALLPRADRQIRLAGWDFDCCCLGCKDTPFNQRQGKFRSFRKQLHKIAKRDASLETSYRASQILLEGYESEYIFTRHYVASACNLAEYELLHERAELALEWLNRCARNVLIAGGSNRFYKRLSNIAELLQAVIRDKEPLRGASKLRLELQTLSLRTNLEACRD